MPPAAAWEGSAGRGSARISFAVFAHGAFPAEMHHAQKLQKIFSVAEGDHFQGSSYSVEREYCPHCLNRLELKAQLTQCSQHFIARISSNLVNRLKVNS